jgi:HK97 family phage portal protein
LTLARKFRSFLSNASIRADAGLGVVGTLGGEADYWYRGMGHRSAAGPEVSAGSATRLAPVFSCTRVVTETFGALPVGIYRERKSGGRDAATDHPAMELFLQPNQWQTGMEFFEMMQGHLELRGNAYAHKVSGNGNAIDQLVPLHPDRVRVYLLPDGRLRYEVTAYSSGQIDRYSQDEILHFRSRSNDGIMGISTVGANMEAIGVGLAQQEHRAASFRHRAIPGLSIETTKQDDEKREQLAASIEERFSGDHAFSVMVLPPGMKATELGISNKDAQLIEASAATAIEVCGFFRVPPHKIGIMARGTFSNIEQQNIEFATDCMWPRIVRVERRLDRDIVGALRYKESAPGDYFAVFNMDALYRGDMKTRFEAYQQGVQTWLTINEIRAAEGKNPIAGGDELLIPVNMETRSQAQARSDANIAAANASADDAADARRTSDAAGDGAEPLGDENDNQKAQARHEFVAEQSAVRRAGKLATASAERIVRREVKTLRKLAAKSAADGPPIEGEVWDFYRELTPVVAESMAISAGMAAVYCNSRAAVITTARSTLRDIAIDRIEETGPQELAALALKPAATKEAIPCQ